MKKLAILLFVALLATVSCKQEKQINAPQSAKTLTYSEDSFIQALSWLHSDASDLLYVYHEQGKALMDYENNGFVVGFATGKYYDNAGHRMAPPVCQSSSAVKFARCVDSYVRDGHCVTVQYKDGVYYAYDAACPN